MLQFWKAVLAVPMSAHHILRRFKQDHIVTDRFGIQTRGRMDHIMKFKKLLAGTGASMLLAGTSMMALAPDANAASMPVYNVGSQYVGLSDNCGSYSVAPGGSVNLRCGNRKALVPPRKCVKWSGKVAVCNHSHTTSVWATKSWSIDATVKRYNF